MVLMNGDLKAKGLIFCGVYIFFIISTTLAMSNKFPASVKFLLIGDPQGAY
jgi:hypothetical protein